MRPIEQPPLPLDQQRVLYAAMTVVYESRARQEDARSNVLALMRAGFTITAEDGTVLSWPLRPWTPEPVVLAPADEPTVTRLTVTFTGPDRDELADAARRAVNRIQETVNNDYGVDADIDVVINP